MLLLPPWKVRGLDGAAFTGRAMRVDARCRARAGGAVTMLAAGALLPVH